MLAQRRQKIQQQSKLIAEAQLQKAQVSLLEQQKLRQEKDQLVSQIESSKRSQLNKAKLRLMAKRRDAFLERLKQKKSVDAHKALIEASNTRVLSRLGTMQEKRKRVADLKRKRLLAQQLSKANAVRLLQQKKLQNLRKETSTAGSVVTQVLQQSSSALSPLTRLSPNEKLQMLSWLDLEKNAEILAKTDKAIKDKMKAKLTADKLVQQAARQVVDDYDYDDLTDEEIDEILLTLTGGSAVDLDDADDYYDDLLDEYVDDVDLLDILGDYDVDPIRRPPPAISPPLVPAVAVGPVQPSLTPLTPAPQFAPQPVSPAGPVYTPAPVNYSPYPTYPSVTPTPPPTYSYSYFHQSTPLPVTPAVTPAPFHHSTPAPYHHNNYNHHPHDYHHHYGPEPVKKPVTHLHIHQKKPPPTPPPPAHTTVEVHHYHTTPKPLYKEEHYYHKPTPKPYLHYTTRPPRHQHHYEPLPPGPPYPTTRYPKYEDEYDYEYYDSYDPPPVQFDPVKVKFTTPRPPRRHPIYTNEQYINTYSTPVTPEPYYTTTVRPYAPYREPYHHSPYGHYQTSGHRFLEGVSAIFDGAATGAVHPHDVGPIVGSSLLQDIQDKVHSELNLGPEGGRFTKLVVGSTTQPPPTEPPLALTPDQPPPVFLPGFEPRVDITPHSKPVQKPRKRPTYDGYATGSSESPKAEKKPRIQENADKVKAVEPGRNGQLSFSALMSDFLLNKPLPFNAAQKSRKSG